MVLVGDSVAVGEGSAVGETVVGDSVAVGVGDSDVGDSLADEVSLSVGETGVALSLATAEVAFDELPPDEQPARPTLAAVAIAKVSAIARLRA